MLLYKACHFMWRQRLVRVLGTVLPTYMFLLIPFSWFIVLEYMELFHTTDKLIC